MYVANYFNYRQPFGDAKDLGMHSLPVLYSSEYVLDVMLPEHNDSNVLVLALCPYSTAIGVKSESGLANLGMSKLKRGRVPSKYT